MRNKDKIILDLYGGTGSWSKPYVGDGYDVKVVTLPECDVRDYKLPDKDVYGILAAPPCTHFSYARTTAKTPRDLKGAMELVEAALQIIWEARYKNKLEFWALENPNRGMLKDFLGKPAYVFDPKDFRDRYTKSTALWGDFNEPKKDVIELTDKEKSLMKTNSRKLPKLPKDYVLPKGQRKQSARRAITPEGFARAFYEANK